MESDLSNLNKEFLNVFAVRLKASGLKKKNNSWYLVSDQTISVINLQKSQWSNLYYINYGVFLFLYTIERKLLPEYKAELRFRLTGLMTEEKCKLVETVLNLEHTMDFKVREEIIISLLDEIAIPLLGKCRTISGVRELYESSIKKIARVTSAGRSVLDNK